MRTAHRIAVDIEANSLYAYQEQVCLIQVSTETADYIIDPLAGFPLDGFDEVMANPAIEKVFHASDYDLMLLHCHYSWKVNALFDTMWAGRILGQKNMGLAWFLNHYYGITICKKYQKANWAARPLSDDQLTYAQTDTHYLLRLRDELARQLQAQGLYEEALEIFKDACRVETQDRSFHPDRFWSVRGARLLKPRAQAILRMLFVFRDREARMRDWPPFKIVGDDKLTLVAQYAPRTRADLLAIPGITPKLADRYGDAMLRAVNDGRQAPLPTPPHGHRNPPGVARRYSILAEWRKETAQKRGVESDVIISRDAMWEIAHMNPRTLEDIEKLRNLGPRRRALYAEDILRRLDEEQSS
jgi:ribonuclease D